MLVRQKVSFFEYKINCAADINELEQKSYINILPNPVQDKLYIETQTLTIEIYDIYGRRQVTETPSHQGNLSIDVSNLKSGVYFVKVVTENGETVQRFVKK